MAFTSDLVLGGRMTGLFVGGQGSGKTIAAASFPLPMMIYDFDGRMAPVKHFYPNKRIEYKVVGAYDAPRGRTDVINFYDFCTEFENLQNRCDYATVVIDSITSYTATVVRYQLNKKGKNKGKQLANLIDVPTWDEFNGECQAVIETIEIAKILPCHVIFTAHPVDKTEILKVGGTETVRKSQSITAFGNKTPSFVPNYFDEIYNFTKETRQAGAEPSRIVTTLAGDDTLCKTALPLPSRFEITNQPFFRVVQGYLAEHQLKLNEAIVAAAVAEESRA